MPLLIAEDREDDRPNVWCDQCQTWHPVPQDHDEWEQIGCLAPYESWLAMQGSESFG